MNRKRFVFLWATLICVAIILLGMFIFRGRQSLAISPGMTKAEVQALIGEPEGKSTYPPKSVGSFGPIPPVVAEEWHYPAHKRLEFSLSAPRFSIMKERKHVWFDKEGKVGGVTLAVSRGIVLN